MRLVLYTRPGCHLCDVAKEALDRVGAQTGEGWTEVDIETDPALEDEYGFRVPVVTLDGREHGYWRVDEERLKQDLNYPRPGG